MYKNAQTSILNSSNISKKRNRIVLGPGRYSHGVHKEDVDYLVYVFLKSVEAIPGLAYKELSLEQSFILLQMIGVPGRTLKRSILTSVGANKIQEHINRVQDHWYFVFEVGTIGFKYKITDVSTIGGNEAGLGGLFDL